MTAWPYPLWIAHRGAGRLAPENTLAAFRVGAAHGYRAFECDVKLSADGIPFLLHDATLQRTTSGHGNAALLSWAELARLDAGGRIQRLHRAGLRALVYTVNDPPEARRLVALGIDGLITDAVDRFSRGSAVHD